MLVWLQIDVELTTECPLGCYKQRCVVIVTQLEWTLTQKIPFHCFIQSECIGTFKVHLKIILVLDVFFDNVHHQKIAI